MTPCTIPVTDTAPISTPFSSSQSGQTLAYNPHTSEFAGCEIVGPYVDHTGNVVGSNFPILSEGAGNVSEAPILGLARSYVNRFLVT